MEKQLYVVDTSKSEIVFENHPVQNETYLECTVTNIFPRPKIHLVLVFGYICTYIIYIYFSPPPFFFFLYRSNDENIILSSNITSVEKLDNDYFNASMTAVAQNIDDDPDAFSCFVTFEGLTWNLTANTIRSSSGKTAIIFNYFWYLLSIIFSIELFNLF